MSAVDHIETAIHALRSSLGASGEPPGPGSRESKAIWYLNQARECLQDAEPLAEDTTKEIEAGQMGQALAPGPDDKPITDPTKADNPEPPSGSSSLVGDVGGIGSAPTQTESASLSSAVDVAE